MALHLCRVELPATDLTPAIDISCPLPDDLQALLQNHMGSVLEDSAEALLAEAGLELQRRDDLSES